MCVCVCACVCGLLLSFYSQYLIMTQCQALFKNQTFVCLSCVSLLVSLSAFIYLNVNRITAEMKANVKMKLK